MNAEEKHVFQPMIGRIDITSRRDERNKKSDFDAERSVIS